MRKTILFILISASSFKVFSQQDSLLNAFKYRITQYKAINLALDGSIYSDKKDLLLGTYKSRSSGGGISSNYYFLKSTDKILLTMEGNLSSYFNSHKSQDPSYTAKNKSYFIATHFKILNKWFSRKMFTELGAGLSASTYSAKDIRETIPHISREEKDDYDLSLQMGIGKGRIENITDMQNALWLNLKLSEVKRLSRPLATDELIELGRAITQGNNTRVLDARKMTQFILKTVDKFLQQKQLINTTDIDYFAELNDILFFAFNNYRLAGTEKFIRITPSIFGFNHKRNQQSQPDKFEQSPIFKSVLLAVGYNSYKPFNLKHQNNFGVAIKSSYLAYRSTQKYFTGNTLINTFHLSNIIKQIGLALFYEHAFYPSTRTNINIMLKTESGYQDSDFQSVYYGTSSASSLFNYFISYRTRLSCQLGVNYNKNIFSTSYDLVQQPDNFQFFANAGIGISL